MGDIFMLLIIIVVVICIWYISEYNKIKRLEKKVEQAKSAVDIFLIKRFDLIPNLVECVKGYMKYEEKMLEIIITERSKFLESKDLDLGNEVNRKCNKILTFGDIYPELKANEQFLYLENTLKKIEDELNAARRLYNSDVTMYNTAISEFPCRIVANNMKAKKKELIKTSEEVRETKFEIRERE